MGHHEILSGKRFVYCHRECPIASGGWIPLQVDIQDWPGIDTPLHLVFRAQTDWAFPTDFTVDNIRFITACQ